MPNLSTAHATWRGDDQYSAAQFHGANLLAKLGAQNHTDAVRIGYARGLIEV